MSTRRATAPVRSGPTRRRRPRCLLPLLAAILVALAMAATASAHASLVQSVPPYGASLQGAPASIRLEFDEAISGKLSSVSLIGSKTGPVRAVRIAQAGSSALSVELPQLQPDLYRVEWRAVAEDDLHPTSGALVFGVDTAVPIPAPGAGVASSPGGAAPGEVALRWVDFGAIALLIGVLGVVAFVLGAAARRGARGLEELTRPLLRLALAGGIVALASGTGLLVMQTSRAGGTSTLGGVLGHTSYGQHWIERQALLLALIGMLGLLRRSPRRASLRGAAAALGLALVLPLALVSHAASFEGAWSVATLLIALHILTAALWAGGVVALCVSVAVLIRRGDRESARILARAFGGYAAVSVALLAITGIGSLGLHVRSLDALLNTGYGTTLIVKTGLFLLAGAIGLATTIGLRAERAPGRLGTWWASAPRAEAAVLTAVLILAALLTATPPARARVAQASQEAAPAPHRSIGQVADLVISTLVEPNRPGPSFVTVEVDSVRRPAPAPVRAVTLTLSRPGSPARTVNLARADEHRWQTVATLEPGGATLGIVVKRPGLADVVTRTSWTVPPPSPNGATPQSQAADQGITQRPLEPILRPIALGGALLLGLILVAVAAGARARRRRRQSPRTGPEGVSEGLHPNGAER